MKSEDIGLPGRNGFQTITPYVMVADIDQYASFLQDAFGATETYRTTGAGGGTHLEVQIGTSRLMVGESTQSARPTYLFLYVSNVESVFSNAVSAGGSELMKPAAGIFQEETGAAVSDPAGNTWFLASHGPGSESP